MKKYILLLIIFLGQINTSYSQGKVFKGVLLDSTNQQPIAYANILLTGKGRGTYSNQQGYFELTLNNASTVQISVIGYHTKTLKLTPQLSVVKIFLRPDVKALKEIIVKPFESEEVLTLGFDNKKKRIKFHLNSAGCEIAVFIPNTTSKKALIKAIKIPMWRGKKNVLFRLNLYKIGEKGKPGTTIPIENKVFSNRDIKKNLLYYDVSKWQITVPKEGVFVSLETLGIKEKQHLMTSVKDTRSFSKLKLTNQLSETFTYVKTAFKSNAWSELPAIISEKQTALNVCCHLLVEVAKD